MAIVECFRHRLLVDEGVASEVEHHDAGLHAGDRIGIDHALGVCGGGHVDGDEVAFRIDGADVGDVLDATVEAPGRVDREERIEAVGLHAEPCGGVGDGRTDGPEADDAELLARELGTRKAVLGLLGLLAHVRVIAVLADPLVAADDVAAGEQHPSEDELLHGVCVGAGRVEDDDALIGAAVDGDVVHPGTGSRDGQEGLRKLDLVEVGASHEDGVGTVKLAHEFVGIAEAVGADLGDVVHAMDLVHGFSFAGWVLGRPAALRRRVR